MNKKIKGLICNVAAIATFAMVLTPVNLENIITNAAIDTVDIQVLATSDLHGKFMPYDYALNATDTSGSLTQISTKVNELRTVNPNTILIDNGDIIQGNSSELSLDSNPQVMIAAMNAMNYDAITLGNHEFNYGVPKLQTVMSKSNAPVLSANVYDSTGKRLFNNYTIVEKAGVKVGIIGVTTPNITRWDSENLKNYKVTNAIDEVKAAVTALNGEADVIVVSYHAGEKNEYDYQGSGVIDLLSACSGVDAVVAAHEHKKVGAAANQVSYSGVKIVENLPTGQTLAQLNIKVTKLNGKYTVVDKLNDVQTDVISVKNGISDVTLEGKLQSYHTLAIADAETVIGTLTGGNLVPENEVTGIATSQIQETSMIKLINDVQRNYTGADISAAAAFSETANIKEGTIKKCDTSLIYKFANTLYKLEMTGKQLKQYMEWSAQFYNTYKDGDLTLSFNSNVKGYNYDMFSGLKYDVDVTKSIGNRIVNLKKTDGSAITESDVFTVAVNNYRANSQLQSFGTIDPITGIMSSPYILANGDTLPKILEKDVRGDLGGVRELIGDYIKNVKGGAITPKLENNWKVIGANWDSKLRAIAVKAINNGTITIAQYNPVTITADTLATNGIYAPTTKSYKTIDILSINDFHGTLIEDVKGKNVGASKLVSAVKEYKVTNPNTLVVSGGDNYQGSPLSNLTKGAPVSAMLKEMGVVASALGNHEFDWGTDLLDAWKADGNLDFLASNIYDKTTGAPVSFAKPYKIVTIDGVKIAFIGLATPETAFKTLPQNVANLEFKSPSESAKYWTDYLKSGKAGETVDTVVALTHLGAAQNSTTKEITGEAADLANANIGLDAIITAHTHNTVAGSVNGTPIVQGYYNGRTLGKLSFTFDGSKLLAIVPSIDNLAARKGTIVEDATMKEIISKYLLELDPILSEVIGKTDIDLSHNKTKDGVSVLGKWTTDMMRKITDTQIAITNGGGLRAPIAAGNITVGNLYEVMPFDNTFVNMKLSGADIKKVLENGIGNSSIGSVQYSGVKATYDLNRAAGDRITALALEDGTPLVMDKLYTVTTNDFMFTGGDNYSFSGAVGAVDTGLPIRDGIVTYLRTQLAAASNTSTDSEVINASKSNIKDNLSKTGSASFDMTVLIALIAMLTLAGTCVLKTNKKDEEVA